MDQKEKKLKSNPAKFPDGMTGPARPTGPLNLRFGLLALFFIVLAGVAGYNLIEGWPLIDSLFMTIITLTTVGYGEIHPLSSTGRLFTIVLIALGVGFVAYTLGSLTHWIVESQMRQILGRRRLQKQIERLEGHYIICGFGRMGTTICSDLAANAVPFVVIEKDDEVIEKEIPQNFLYLQGDSTDDDMLLAAGIRRAKGLVAVAASDVDNVYITLTARQLNPELFILSRAADETAERKLKQAGASRVISPYQIGARRMVLAVLRPAVIDFLDAAMNETDFDLQMEEHLVGATSRLAGRSLLESNIRKEHGLIVVAIKRSRGEMVFNPPADTSIEKGDKLITMGPRENLDKLDLWME